MRLRDIVLAASCALLLAAPAFAQTTYVGTLSGSQEVPAVATPATGSATVVLNAAQTQLSVSVQFQNLVGTYTASHIHGPTAAGTNGPVKWGFIGTGAGWVFTNANHDGTISNFLVSGITPTDVSNLNSGLHYVNIHSNTFPGGELRALLSALPVPVAPTSWGRVKSLFR